MTKIVISEHLPDATVRQISLVQVQNIQTVEIQCKSVEEASVLMSRMDNDKLKLDHPGLNPYWRQDADDTVYLDITGNSELLNALQKEGIINLGHRIQILNAITYGQPNREGAGLFDRGGDHAAETTQESDFDALMDITGR